MAEPRCPTCKKVLVGGPTGPHRPFCSERCRVIDLGSWLDAAYRIGSPMSEEDLDEGLPEGARPGQENDEDDDAKN